MLLVGTTGTTLKTAIQEMKKLHNYAPDQVNLLNEKEKDQHSQSD
jgi:hypothetical protein